jgi:hypothetical protein
MDEKYFIIFPSGDKSKLSLVRLTPPMEYEINDYSVASRKDFHDKEEAIKYAKELAESHGLHYVGDDDGFLD